MNPLLQHEPWSVEIIADSINESDVRLTCFKIVCPKFLFAQITRHRSFSFSAASSRAIPTKYLIEYTSKYPFFPWRWGENRPGMSDAGPITPGESAECLERAKKEWKEAIDFAKFLESKKVHKQVVNRYLEPYTFAPMLIQGTDWENFFALRCADDAQPELQKIVDEMLELYLSSTPVRKYLGQWHLPYADKHVGNLPLPELVKISAARCARCSYANMEGAFLTEKDISLHDTLLGSGHFSPLEFPAYAVSGKKKVANYSGWCSYRHTLPEHVRNVDLSVLLQERKNKKKK